MFKFARPLLIEHQELGCSEIENILPVNLLYDSIESTPAIHDLHGRLEFLKRYSFSNPELHNWFDLKNGNKLSKIKETNSNAQERQYWINAASHIENPFHCEADCKENNHCPKVNPKECSCVLLPGLGDETLDRFNAHCSTLTLLKQCERVKTSPNVSDWLNLGAIIASWGVALEKQRS